MKKVNFKERKTRIVLLSAPMFLLPLALLAFSIYAGMEKQQTEPEQQLNSSLPQINEKRFEAEFSKTKTYENEKLEKDWFRAVTFFEEDTVPVKEASQELGIELERKGLHQDAEKLIEEQLSKLQELQQSINQPEPSELKLSEKPKTLEATDLKASSHKNPEIGKLEEMIDRMEAQKGMPDPELLQLENLLDKIMMLQFPERFQEEIQMVSSEVFEVSPLSGNTGISASSAQEEAGFFGLSEGPAMQVDVPVAIPAEIDENKKIISGNSLRIKITEDVDINGLVFPAQTKIYGTCRLEGERLLIQVDNIRTGRHLLPVKLEAFGMDAIKGVHIPGALGRDAAKEGMGQGVQGMNPMMMGGLTLETQLAASGIETARGFLGKKTKLKKVNVKQGHPLLLVDKS